MSLTDADSVPAESASSPAAANGSSTQSQPLFRDNDAATESDSDSLSSLLDVDDPALIALQTASARSTDPSPNVHSRSVEKPLASAISTSQIQHSLNSSPKGQIRPSAHSGGALASTSHSPFATLQHYTSEKAAMHAIADVPRAVLLFSHPEFPLCKVMETHLGRIAGAAAASTGWLPSSKNVRVKQNDMVRGEILQETDIDGLKSKGSGNDNEKLAEDRNGADRNMGKNEDEKEENWSPPERSLQENTLFLALQAEESPFLTARLRIRVLPAVIGYVSGEEVGRLTGLEGLGKLGKREAGWRRVSAVLRSWGVLGREMLIGEDDDEDEDEEGDSSDDGEAWAENAEQRDRGNWIGGGRGTRTRGIRKTAKENDDDDDDDWD